MREEYLKYVLAFKNMNTESKKSELVSQLAELIKFINDTNKQIDIPEAYLPVLTNVVEEDDYLTQLRQMKKMGSFSSILKMIPGMNKFGDIKVDDKEFIRIEAIICSMTKKEKQNTKLLNASRRQRIAKGSGTTVEQINKFMKSFEMTQKMMKEMTSNKGMMRKMMKNLNMDDLKDFSNFN